MACRYTYLGKTYSATKFDDVLRAMPPMEAAKYMPHVESIPSAPFVGSTDAWLRLSLTRMIRYAAENGFERVAWATGTQQAERYDLSKRLSTVAVAPVRMSGERAGQEGGWRITGKDHSGRNVITQDISSLDKLDDYIGKDAADKLRAQVAKNSEGNTPRGGSLSGLDLKIGGEGMRAFYDEILPNVANDVLKKLGGGRVTEGSSVVQRGIQNQRYDGPTLTKSKIADLLDGESRAWSVAVRQQMQDTLTAMDRGADFKTAIEKNGSMTLAEAIGGVMVQDEIIGRQPGFDITPALRESAMQGMPLFSRLSPKDDILSAFPTGGMAPQLLERYVRRITGRWAQPLDVRVAKSAAEVRKQTGATKDQIPDDTNGLHWGGTIWLIADNIGSAKKAKMILAHEAIGHYGMEAVLGERFPGLVKKVRAWKAAGVKPILELYADVKRTHGELKPDQAAKEVIARIAERQATLPGALRALWDQIVTAVKQFLRERLFINLEFSPTELRALVRAVGRYIETGEGFAPAAVRAMGGDINLARDIQVMLTTREGQAELADDMRQRIADIFTSQRSFNRWWHKTIGTQFHKGRVNRHFRPVFEKGQDFLNDVSRYSIEAEELAPNLLSKLSTPKDLLKLGLSRKDSEAIADPIFKGTLLDERVYKDAELRERFHLTDQQIVYYREFRAAVDKSLDDAAKSSMARIARSEGITAERIDGLRNQTISLREFANQLMEDIRLRSEALEDKKILKSAKAIDNLAVKIEGLKFHGYAPLMRFGEYTVYAYSYDPMSGEDVTLFFGMYESQREANEAARAVTEEFPEATVQQGVMSKEAFRLFRGISPETLEIFAEHAELADDPLFQHYLRLVVSNHSALRRLIHRKGTPGFSKDVTRVLASFVTSNARLASSNYHMGDMKRAVDAIPKEAGDVKDEAVKLYTYLSDPVEEAAKLRSYLFLHFIGGSIAAALVNMTQPVTMTAPYLAQFANVSTVAKELGRAAIDQGGPIKNQTLAQDLARAEREGVVAPHEVHQLMAEARGGLGRQVWLRNILRIWGSFFALAEQFNRRTTFIAAYRIAVRNGVRNTYDFAVQAVQETQGIYNKGNRPNWARGPVGATLFTFKQFSIMYIELLLRLPPKQRLLALGILVLLSGVEGLPFADDLKDLIDTLGQWMGFATNSKRAVHRMLAERIGEGGANFVLYGVSAVPGVPLDIQARMGMHNLIPGTALLKPSETRKGREIQDVVGPAGGLAAAIGEAATSIGRGEWGKATSAVIPIAVQNVLRGAQMLATGEARTREGLKIRETNAVDAILRMTGFASSQIAMESRRMANMARTVSYQRQIEDSIADQWASAIYERDRDGISAARQRLAEWNIKNPGLPIRITRDQLKRRVQARVRTREQRFARTVPQEIRRSVLEQIKTP